MTVTKTAMRFRCEYLGAYGARHGEVAIVLDHITSYVHHHNRDADGFTFYVDVTMIGGEQQRLFFRHRTYSGLVSGEPESDEFIRFADWFGDRKLIDEINAFEQRTPPPVESPKPVRRRWWHL